MAENTGRRQLKMTPPVRKAPSETEALAATSGEKDERLSVDVPRDLKKRLKMKSVEDGTTVRQLVIDALEGILS